MRLQFSVCGLRSCRFKRFDTHSYARGHNRLHQWRKLELSRGSSTACLVQTPIRALSSYLRGSRSRFEFPDKHQGSTQEEGCGILNSLPRHLQVMLACGQSGSARIASKLACRVTFALLKEGRLFKRSCGYCRGEISSLASPEHNTA